MAALDDEERAHLEELRAIDRRNLRILERQIESHGEDDAPQYMIARRDELRTKLGLTGKMVRGEFSEEILDLLRQFGEKQSLMRAIANLDREFYNFKKETWDFREREAVARQERNDTTDKRFTRIEMKVGQIDNKTRWMIVIALVILALLAGYAMRAI